MDVLTWGQFSAPLFSEVKRSKDLFILKHTNIVYHVRKVFRQESLQEKINWVDDFLLILDATMIEIILTSKNARSSVKTLNFIQTWI